MKLRPAVRRLRQSIEGWSGFVLGTIATGVCVVTISYTAYARVLPFVEGHEYFRLRTVHVSCDAPLDGAKPDLLAGSVDLFHDSSLWKVDTKQVEGELEEISWVRDAAVTRRFPAQVSLRIEQREAIAATLTDDGPFLIDADGVAFRPAGMVGYADLPYLEGWDVEGAPGDRRSRLRRLVTVVELARSYGYEPSEVSVDPIGDYWLFPEQPRVAVRLGPGEDFDPPLRRMRAALAELGEAVSEVRQLDVRTEEQIVVKAAGGDLQRLLRAISAREDAALARGELRG